MGAGQQRPGRQEPAAQAPAADALAADAVLQGLNQEQRAAAMHPLDRPLLVQAGAGTGKTTTLMARVAFALQQARPRAAAGGGGGRAANATWATCQGVGPDADALLLQTPLPARRACSRAAS